MKIFESFNQSTICPICNTSNEGQAVLIPIDGTDKDRNCEAIQVHLDCIELRVNPETERGMFIYQIVEK